MFSPLLCLKVKEKKKKACKEHYKLRNWKTAVQGRGCDSSLTYQFHPDVYFPTCFLQRLSSALRNVHPVSGSRAERWSPRWMLLSERSWSACCSYCSSGCCCCCRCCCYVRSLGPGPGTASHSPAPLQRFGLREAGPAPATVLRFLKGPRAGLAGAPGPGAAAAARGRCGRQRRGSQRGSPRRDHRRGRETLSCMPREQERSSTRLCARGSQVWRALTLAPAALSARAARQRRRGPRGSLGGGRRVPAAAGATAGSSATSPACCSVTSTAARCPQTRVCSGDEGFPLALSSVWP